jgi:hypothetical protein
VPFYKETNASGVDEVFFFNVFRKQEWAFVGGNITLSSDKTFYDAAQRLWRKEAGALLNFSWQDAFRDHDAHFREWTLSEGEVAVNSGAFLLAGRFLLVHASERFYNATRDGVTDMVTLAEDGATPQGFVRGTDSAQQKRRIHTHGDIYIEHDVCRWLSLAHYDAAQQPQAYPRAQAGAVEANVGKIRHDNITFICGRESEEGQRQPWWQWVSAVLGMH